MSRVIALGFFDGVHLGHQALLAIARKRADELGVCACALTFDPHPEVLLTGKAKPLLNSMEDRRWLITELCAMDDMLVLPFDRKLMELSPEDFVAGVLKDRLEAVHVVCGHDYTFGYQGLGNAESLRELCATIGLGCDVIDPVVAEGEKVSSTRIRKLLQAGDVETANRLLGHRHFFTGIVTHGNQLGRKLGFPTANLSLPEGVLELPYGVYATRMILPDGTQHKAVTNVGVRPTVDGQFVTVESCLMDFSGDLYDRQVRVEFCKFLRPEQKFDSVEALAEAIRRDLSMLNDGTNERLPLSGELSAKLTEG